jgi:hypothetical protein
MPRGSVPEHLKHHPEEVQRNAERFDQLCEIAEEVSGPIVREALIEETKATGAEVLTEEANLALETLVRETPFLDNHDGRETLDKLRESVRDMAPVPIDDSEYQSHTRDVAQVLTGTWVELVRQELSKSDVLMISEQMLPAAQRPMWAYTTGYVINTKKPQPLHALTDALAPLALNQMRILNLLSALREVLFDKPCSIDLPFDIVLVGGPGTQIVAMKKVVYDNVTTERKKSLASLIIGFEPWKSWTKPHSEESKSATIPKSKSVEKLQKPLVDSDLAALTSAALRHLSGFNPSLTQPAEELKHKT